MEAVLIGSAFCPHSSSLLDAMDKNINTFAMRIREWYSWHFPELVKLVNDNLVRSLHWRTV